jgi:hypothetical protein
MKPTVTSENVLLLYDFEFICYTLSNGLQVFSHTRILNIMMIDYSNQNLHKHLSALAPYLPFLFIERKIRLSIVFINSMGYITRGIAYDDFKVLCDAVAKANKQGRLTSKFFLMAMISEQFLLQDVEHSGKG